MALWWFCGGYAFPIVMKLDIFLLFKLNLTLRVTVNHLKKKTIAILTMVFSTSGLNLVILVWTGHAILCRQAQNKVNLDFQVKFDFEGTGQWFHNTIGILTKVFYTSDPNLVILAWTGHQLLCRQASDWHTDTQTQATTIPEGQNWPWVKR